MTLGEQIKQAREDKNLSQEDLAEKLGVSRQAISKWENNSALPQGMNRELLYQVLGIEAEEVPKKRGISWFGGLGWTVAILLLFLFLFTMGQSKTEPAPALKSVTFYDAKQEIVAAEALWYDASKIESILILWEGGTPNSIRMFATPTGTETEELTELLLTKSVLDGDSVQLITAAPLKELSMSHVFFQLDFGTTVVTSNYYNVIYAP